ncbi:hypothetical protein EMPG_14500 [Blastomyces silverae]|uniref:Uncharacterized protein n=1 Tax=Blastomyces silverae TaxID=2060906 RepID=A0A0H1BFF4_9EURO|nr:hypothetical protein EMPG_14500 [Blastomyces silverae]
MASHFPSQARALYRSVIRELPHRPLSSRSPLAIRIRTHLSPQQSPESSNSNSNSNGRQIQIQIAQAQMDEAEQFTQYLRAQREYVTLLERYNPGANMDEEERVRLTARRVGMELPVEAEGDQFQTDFFFLAFAMLRPKTLSSASSGMANFHLYN